MQGYIQIEQYALPKSASQPSCAFCRNNKHCLHFCLLLFSQERTYLRKRLIYPRIWEAEMREILLIISRICTHRGINALSTIDPQREVLKTILVPVLANGYIILDLIG